MPAVRGRKPAATAVASSNSGAASPESRMWVTGPAEGTRDPRRGHDADSSARALRGSGDGTGLYREGVAGHKGHSRSSTRGGEEPPAWASGGSGRTDSRGPRGAATGCAGLASSDIHAHRSDVPSPGGCPQKPPDLCMSPRTPAPAGREAAGQCPARPPHAARRGPRHPSLLRGPEALAGIQHQAPGPDQERT